MRYRHLAIIFGILWILSGIRGCSLIDTYEEKLDESEEMVSLQRQLINQQWKYIDVQDSLIHSHIPTFNPINK